MSKSRFIESPGHYSQSKLLSIIVLSQTERGIERERERIAVGRVGGSGGAMVLGKLSVPRRPTNSDNSRARASCACSRCGWGFF